MKKIGKAIVIDFSEIVSSENGQSEIIVDNTVNTWQIGRDIKEKKADTKIGKLAEDAVKTALNVLGINCYHSYDNIRNDNYKLHAPFDGVLSIKLNDDMVQLIRQDVQKSGAKLSSSTRNILRNSRVYTVEVKSTRLADKYKVRAGFKTYDSDVQLHNLVSSLRKLDFITYPFFTRYGNFTFQQYCMFAEKRLKTSKRGKELEEHVRQIELDNANDVYIRVFMDENKKKAIILGWIDKESIFSNPKTHKLILPGKSEIPLYFVKSIESGYPIDKISEFLIL